MHVVTFRLGLAKSFEAMGHLPGYNNSGHQAPGGIRKSKYMGRQGFISARAHMIPGGDTSD